jgi:4-hydroxymandelate oxidase
VDDALTLADVERLAADRLPRAALDYYASGADDEVTLRRNRAAFEARALYPRVLVDVARVDPSTTALGTPLPMPVLVAPTAFHRLAHPDGEAGTARGAGAAGVPMILSTLATMSVEEVAAAATGPLWFQLYIFKDRGATRALVDRVVAAGCRALVLTVDAPVIARRDRDARNGFSLPPELGLANLPAAGAATPAGERTHGGVAGVFADYLDPSVTWRDLDWLAAQTRLPIVLKGIHRADDAVRSVDHGARAIVVSNHGGRQLDGAVASLDALPPIAAAVDGRVELYVDGGVRRGTDVVKALALGARAVLLGRPILWGLAVGGDRGVARVLGMLREELERAMALCGAPTVAAIDRSLVG